MSRDDPVVYTKGSLDCSILEEDSCIPVHIRLHSHRDASFFCSTANKRKPLSFQNTTGRPFPCSILEEAWASFFLFFSSPSRIYKEALACCIEYKRKFWSLFYFGTSFMPFLYGVATVSRILKIMSLFCKGALKKDDILQKRPVNFRSLLIETTPYLKGGPLYFGIQNKASFIPVFYIKGSLFHLSIQTKLFFIRVLHIKREPCCISVYKRKSLSFRYCM